ncbi:osteocalcin [Elgaria multicarinata webbii]|uniref:osteocalcin n=1 Tax=Elgaria multicarinata webbii TaxID=159646 RepID=UPI002FCD5AE7
MNTLTLLSFLAVAALCLCRADDSAPSNSAKESPSVEAFISKRDSAELVKRHRRDYNRLSGAAVPTKDPFEPYREVCELSPQCDELADQIGFHEAYRRFYGPL